MNLSVEIFGWCNLLGRYPLTQGCKTEFIQIEADPSSNQTHATRYGEVIEADVKRDRVRRVDGRSCRSGEMLSHFIHNSHGNDRETYSIQERTFNFISYSEILWSVELCKPALVGRFQTTSNVSQLYWTVLLNACFSLFKYFLMMLVPSSGFLALAVEVAPGSSDATFKGLWFCYLCYRVGLAVLTKDVWSLGHLLLCHL